VIHVTNREPFPEIRRALQVGDLAGLRTELLNLTTPNVNGKSGVQIGKESQFDLNRLPDLRDLDMEISWLVEDLIPEGAVTLLTGDSGVGKSTLALTLAGAVAHGEPFLGLKTKKRKVLFVDGENPGSVVKERLNRLSIARTDGLKIWGGWNKVAPMGPGCPSVIAWAKEHQGLLVFDSLIQFHPGSEQDSSETRKYMAYFRSLANLGATVLILHNTGKGENARQYRGSSDIKASVDQALVLESVGESETRNRTLILKPFKSRIGDAQTLRIDFANGVFTVTSATVPADRKILLDVVRANPNQSGRELTKRASAAGVPKSRSERLLVEGKKDGWLIVTQGRGRSNLYRCR
jgi:archaellum biogenesis ATPase FlaH